VAKLFSCDPNRCPCVWLQLEASSSYLRQLGFVTTINERLADCLSDLKQLQDFET
jgi:hypothetical protein